MRSLLLLSLVARCLETIDVSIKRMFVFMSVVVTVWGSVCCASVVVKDSVLALKCSRMLYVCVRGVVDAVYSVCTATRGAVCARVLEL